MFLPAVAFADDKFIAKASVVDVESILEHSIAIAQIKKSINIISDRIQEELSVKESDLKIIEADLIQKRGILSEEEFNNMVADFNKKVSATQQEMQYKKSALEQAHSAALAEVYQNTTVVISELSKKYGFNIVLPSAQVLFVENDLNITLEVITSLNERLKTVEVKYNVEGYQQ
jgi:Skp family chaperone for outer membrane proteins